MRSGIPGGISLHQQIIAYESGVADTVDPLGGSYFVESLTDSLEKEAEQYIKKIDDLGGAVAAIEQGYQQGQIQESAYRYQKEIESGQEIVVGVNKFVSPHPPVENLLRIQSEEAEKQKERLAKVKKERNESEVVKSLKRLEEMATGEENTMPAFIECVAAYATVGEICGVLRKVFGEQKELLVF